MAKKRPRPRYRKWRAAMNLREGDKGQGRGEGEGSRPVCAPGSLPTSLVAKANSSHIMHLTRGICAFTANCHSSDATVDPLRNTHNPSRR